MRIRMLPISFTFNRFPRMVRDLAKQFDKKINLKLSGEETEIDKVVMEKITDPLVHLVRNSVDHGIEDVATRIANGKSEAGTLHLSAEHEGGNIIIKIQDDGNGLNKDKILQKAIDNGIVSNMDRLTDSQIYELIFAPGFSTADVVSDISGRGVGMDVVRRNILALGGNIEVESQMGTGSTFTISLPLTLAIMEGQLFRLGEQTFVIPITQIYETIQPNPANVFKHSSGAQDAYKLRDHSIPILKLFEFMEIDPSSQSYEEGLFIVTTDGRQLYCLFVDELLEQQQVVIKNLENHYVKVQGISGATILGSGHVALIIDPNEIFKSTYTSTDNVSVSI